MNLHLDKMSKTKSVEQFAHKYIMIVDDEKDILDLFKDYLQINALKVQTYPNPISALSEIQINHSAYSLIISDIRMPDMCGFDFIERVRRIDKDIRIIFMTAFEIEKDRVKKAGNELLTKPIALENLLKTVNKVLASDQ